MENKCLFETRGRSFCSETTFRLTELAECRSNIDDQLKGWHLSQHIAFVQECELILNRSGLTHDLALEQLERPWICERHRHNMKIHAFGDFVMGADQAEYFTAPNTPLSPENHFHSNQICFYSNLGKVFPLPEFQAELFLMRN